MLTFGCAELAYHMCRIEFVMVASSFAVPIAAVLDDIDSMALVSVAALNVVPVAADNDDYLHNATETSVVLADDASIAVVAIVAVDAAFHTDSFQHLGYTFASNLVNRTILFHLDLASIRLLHDCADTEFNRKIKSFSPAL